MMSIRKDVDVFLHKAPVDFRKQINGLSYIVQEEMAIDPFSKALFVFINRDKSRIKLLYWYRNGFCLWMKRLEKDKFVWTTQANSDDVISLDAQSLTWLLEGFDIWNKPPHQTLEYTLVG